jgi:hypothetical protein
MNRVSNSILVFAALFAFCLVLAGCERDADVASRNLSYAADNFEIQRKVTFYNGITGEVMLEMLGLCSLGNQDKVRELTVTCKTGPGAYKKHFLGLSDNVTYFAEQVDPAPTDTYRYRVVFKPASVVPNIEMK